VPSPYGNESFARRRSVHCRLTVKLRGRTTTPDRGRGPILSSGPRGPKQTTPHGPLQRLLGLRACVGASLGIPSGQRYLELVPGVIVAPALTANEIRFDG
jgi:hypothetical protein